MQSRVAWGVINAWYTVSRSKCYTIIVVMLLLSYAVSIFIISTPLPTKAWESGFMVAKAISMTFSTLFLSSVDSLSTC